jgi:hypothetical protein
LTLFSVSLLYALSFPFATVRYARLRRDELSARQPADAPGPGPDGSGPLPG